MILAHMTALFVYLLCVSTGVQAGNAKYEYAISSHANPTILSDGTVALATNDGSSEHVVWLKDSVKVSEYVFEAQSRPVFIRQMYRLPNDSIVTWGPGKGQVTWLRMGKKTFETNVGSSIIELFPLSDGTLILMTSSDSARKFWWVKDGQILHSWIVDQDPYAENPLVLHNKSDTFVVTSSDGIRWLKDGNEINFYAVKGVAQTVALSDGSIVARTLTKLLWLKDGKYLHGASFGNTSKIIVGAEDEVIATETDVEYSPTVKWFKDGSLVHMYRERSSKGRLELHPLPDGRVLAVQHEAFPRPGIKLMLWLSRGTVEARETPRGRHVQAILPDGTVALSNTDIDHATYVFFYKDGKYSDSFYEHDDRGLSDVIQLTYGRKLIITPYKIYWR